MYEKIRARTRFQPPLKNGTGTPMHNMNQNQCMDSLHMFAPSGAEQNGARDGSGVMTWRCVE